MEAKLYRRMEILQSENKKHPKSKKAEKKKEEKTSEKENIYLTEQPYVNISNSEKEIIYPQIGKNESQKKQIINKQRENYLKEKISKMDYNSELFSNIQKDLGKQIENVKTQIKDKNIIISEVPKDLNKYMARSISVENNLIKCSNEDYENKKKYKNLKNLKKEQASLIYKLKKIEENENLLNNEGFNSLNNSSQGTTKFDKSIKEQQMKNIKNKKNEINERLIEIEKNINKILDEEITEDKKKMNIKKFLENFKRDCEIVEARTKRYIKESKERNKHLENILNEAIEKKKKEIEDKEREKQEKIKENIKNEKDNISKRYNENKALMLKYKPYINERYEKTEYLYNLNEKKQIEDDQKLINEAIREKKFKNKSITNLELEEFNDKIAKMKEKIQEEKLKKKKKK